MEYGGMDWIELAQDRDRWLALLTAVMNSRGSIKCGGFLDQLKNLSAYQDGLCSIDELDGVFLYNKTNQMH